MARPHASLLALLLCGIAACQEPQPASPSLREQAHAAEQRGDHASAAELFLQLAKAEPDRAEWQVAAGRCLGRAGRFNEALDLLDAQRKRFPGVLDLPAMLARTMLLKAERDPGAMHPEILLADAAATCREVLATDPNHQDALLVLAQALLRSGDAGARAAAEDATRRLPRHAGALGRALATRWHLHLGGGAAIVLSYAVALWAMTRAPIAPVAALREFSILFGILIARLLLGEHPHRARIAGGVLIPAGAGAFRLG